ncbi:uncharacterized protein [Onthophagus taurus]|uniref:uncharacterized protein n=1 Tax=Onthophagus taurus TaxID=166361 RepID=UPI0039BE556D
MTRVSFYFLFALIITVYSADENTLCTKDYCSKQDCKNANNNVPEECRIQNATHSGIFLPYPGPCNCCDYCLKNLAEGDDCTVGDVGLSPSGSVCGNALTCEELVEKEPEGTCQLISNTECTKAQFAFDEKVNNDTIGHMELREICDRRGLYGHYKCIPGENCYCRSNENKRIFGDIPYSSIANHVLNCACSATYEEVSTFLGRNLKIGEFLRCQSNGDYDTVQCIDDECFCVDAVDGALTYPSQDTVNITMISNETLPCFDYEIHKENYYNPCEKEYLDTLEAASIFEEEVDYVVFGISLPTCQLDGYYAPVQKTKDSYYCSDPEGNQLEGFKVSLNENDYTDMVKIMNCACARARSITTEQKPECLKNGNYCPMQCRRGFCRCVDENGNQIKKEISITSSEYNDYELECANMSGFSEVPEECMK